MWPATLLAARRAPRSDLHGGRFEVVEPQLSANDWSLIQGGPPSATLGIRAFQYRHPFTKIYRH